MNWERGRAFVLLAAAACSRGENTTSSVPAAPRPSVLLVTLDTTRTDAIGPEATGIDTPSFNGLAARGRRFRYAYTTVPQTLPAHTSIMTGLYPGGHGVHENARYLPAGQTVIAERLHAAGYRTEAFVSAFALARQFGLARGFDLYDDAFGEGRVERDAKATTDRVLQSLHASAQPLFLWVHYYDPHYPYAPPEPFRSRYAGDPYRGEVAAMDEQLGRLVKAFEALIPGPHAVVIVGDHGEGLGEHGEKQHGNLLYQSTMHVPLLLIGPGVTAGTTDAPASTRRVFHTILDWAGLGAGKSLRGADAEIILGEAMKPFLDYGWKPQVMAVSGRQKLIFAGASEVYDVVADPRETRDLGTGAVSRDVRAAVTGYPLPSDEATTPPELNDEERRKLASLGYVSSAARPVLRDGAPRPKDMASLFDDLDRASALFVREQYSDAIPVLRRILAKDSTNLSAVLRLAAAESALGHDAEALAAFREAEALSPASRDVRHYLALHYAKGNDWPRAIPLLERIVVEEPDRLPAVEALATIRERQHRPAEALALRERILSMKTPTAPELLQTGRLAMEVGRTDIALPAFERARNIEGPAFKHDLELGVLYMDVRRYDDARQAFDRVPSTDPAYALALFKRAQVSVLLHEPDAAAKIENARRHADATTRELIGRERLFR